VSKKSIPLIEILVVIPTRSTRTSEHLVCNKNSQAWKHSKKLSLCW